MVTQGSQPLKVYVYGASRGKNLWYCIDLESLPDRDKELPPVAEFEDEKRGDWTVIGDHIYWAGGATVVQKALKYGGKMSKRCASRKLYRHDMTINNPQDWKVASEKKKLPMFSPRVVALDEKKICVVGGLRFLYGTHRQDLERYGGEVFNTDTETWNLVALNLLDFASDFTCNNTAILRDKKGEPEQVLYYSSYNGHFLFYNLHDYTFKLQVHTHFALSAARFPEGIKRTGFDGLDLQSFTILMDVVTNGTPVVSDSMLYWFTYDRCLYGYDFVQQRWFRSERLKKNQFLWELADCYVGYHVYPVLVDLYDGTFLLLVHTLSQKLGVASLTVSKSKSEKVLDDAVMSHHTLSAGPDSETLDRMEISQDVMKPKPKPKTGEFLDVKVTSCHNLSADPYFDPRNGMAILKNIGSNAMLEQSNSTMGN